VGSEIKEKGPDGEHRARTYNGGLEAEPPAGSRAEPPGQASSLLALQHPKEGENLALLNDFSPPPFKSALVLYAPGS